MLIFSNTPGVVGTIVTGQALPFAVLIGGNPGVPEFPGVVSAKAILTGFHDSGRSGLGISHTLRDRIYAAIFGERAGKAMVSGIAFAGHCQSDGNWTGFDAVRAYYEACRASQIGALVRLVFGPQTTLAGFMEDFEFHFEDANTGIGAFAFGFVTMPRNAVFRSNPPLPWRSLGDSTLSTGDSGSNNTLSTG